MAAWGHGVGVGADMAHGKAGAGFSSTDDHIIQRSGRAGLSCFWVHEDGTSIGRFPYGIESSPVRITFWPRV